MTECKKSRIGIVANIMQEIGFCTFTNRAKQLFGDNCISIEEKCSAHSSKHFGQLGKLRPVKGRLSSNYHTKNTLPAPSWCLNIFQCLQAGFLLIRLGQMYAFLWVTMNQRICREYVVKQLKDTMPNGPRKITTLKNMVKVLSCLPTMNMTMQPNAP